MIITESVKPLEHETDLLVGSCVEERDPQGTIERRLCKAYRLLSVFHHIPHVTRGEVKYIAGVSDEGYAANQAWSEAIMLKSECASCCGDAPSTSSRRKTTFSGTL
jgi:hypothetical protein